MRDAEDIASLADSMDGVNTSAVDKAYVNDGH